MKIHVCLVLLFWMPVIANGDDVSPVTRALLARYCTDCHGSPEDSPERGFAIGEYLAATPIGDAGPLWKKALDAIDGFQMPPSDSEQPTATERAQMAAGIRERLRTAQSPGKPVLRRLTRLEYNNTVRDLLGLDSDVLMFSERLPFDKAYFNPAAGKFPNRLTIPAREYGARYPVLLRDASLPSDSRAEHGFSNRGDAQNLSAVRLEQYVQLAEQIALHPELLVRARRLQEIFPQARDWQPPSDPPATKPSALVTVAGELAPNDNIAQEADGNPLTLSQFRKRLVAAFEEDRGGVYDVSQNTNSVIAGKGALLKIAYGRKATRVIEFNPTEDIWNAAFATADEASGGALFTNKVKGRKTFYFGIKRVTDPSVAGEWSSGILELGLVVLSRNGQQGEVAVTVEYGDGASQTRRVRLAPGAGTGNTFVSFQAPADQPITKLHIDGSGFSGDYVLLDDLAFITGDRPLLPQALVGVEPPAEEVEHTLVSPKVDATLDLSLATRSSRERLAHFMQRAFRRPVTSSEVDLYHRLYELANTSGSDDEHAMRRAIHGVLSSPSFLYVVERGDSSPPSLRTETAEPAVLAKTNDEAGTDRISSIALTDHELAARLSYFLWSSMPDDELRQLADDGQLQDPKVLEAQARRMLKDPRIRELSESFFVQWLRLRELWSAQPDARDFADFYEGPKGKRTLAQDMFCEALLMFETLLLEDRSVLELVDADETWLNDRLANLYGVATSSANDQSWQRVKLSDARRGGVLTTAATLTLTSFPHRTSPIRRGAWFLETIFNRPPPPPAIAVADIDDQKDAEANLTLREKVERHRANAACAVCHNQIDPPGFALENFDAIGRWRDKDGDEQVDPSGELQGAGVFAGPAEFKQQILAQKERFVRGFVEHMLSYALARKLDYYDTATVEEIVQQVANDDYRFSRVVVEIVKHPTFRNVTLGSEP